MRKVLLVFAAGLLVLCGCERKTDAEKCAELLSYMEPLSIQVQEQEFDTLARYALGGEPVAIQLGDQSFSIPLGDDPVEVRSDRADVVWIRVETQTRRHSLYFKMDRLSAISRVYPPEHFEEDLAGSVAAITGGSGTDVQAQWDAIGEKTASLREFERLIETPAQPDDGSTDLELAEWFYFAWNQRAKFDWRGTLELDDRTNDVTEVDVIRVGHRSCTAFVWGGAVSSYVRLDQPEAQKYRDDALEIELIRYKFVIYEGDEAVIEGECISDPSGGEAEVMGVVWECINALENE